MKNHPMKHRWVVTLALLTAMTTLLAGTQPKFSLTPTTPTTINVLANATATVKYTVTNNTKITRTLTMKPITGISQSTSGAGVCGNPFTLAHNQSCSLTLQINGSQVASHITSGPEICKTMSDGDNAPDPFLCSQPSQIDSLNINQITLSTLSVSPEQLQIIAGGITGQLTITNLSTSLTANNISANLTGTALENEVLQNATDCATVLPSQSCIITFTSGNAAVPLTSFPIQGDNTTQVTAAIEILFPTIAPIAVAGSPLYLTATTGIPVTEYLTVTNQSKLLAATNVQAILPSSLTSQITQDASDCVNIPAGGKSTCNLAFTPIQGGTAVSLTNVIVTGNNTTRNSAQIAVNSNVQVPIVESGSPLILVADGQSTGTMTITNNSTTSAALDVSAVFTGTALETSGVTAVGSGCSSIAPNGGTCTITYKAGTQEVAATTFTIQGSNTTAISAIISVRPPTAILSISPVPSTLTLTASSGISGTFTITNLSPQLDAQDIAPHLAEPLASNVTVTNNCLPTLLRGSSCTIEFTPQDSAVSLQSFGIYGSNTTQVPGTVQIVSAGTAQIGVSGSPLILIQPNGTGTLRIANSAASTVNAIDVQAYLTGSALQAGGVTQTSTCSSIAPGGFCDLNFTAGTQNVSATTVNIFGANTSLTTAIIAVDQVSGPTLTASPASLALLADGTTLGSMTITNLSSLAAAQNVTADFSTTALEGKVTIVSNTCSVIPPLGSCDITFQPGTTIVPTTVFNIYGSNTDVLQASMSIGFYYLYASDFGLRQVWRCLMDTTTGALSSCIVVLSTSNAASPFAPLGITVDPSGKYLYLANYVYENSSVRKYAIDATNGYLSSESVYANNPIATSVAVNPAGTKVYITPGAGIINCGSDNKIRKCTIDSSNGTLSSCGNASNALCGIWGLAFNEVNGLAYITGASDYQNGPYQVYKATVKSDDNLGSFTSVFSVTGATLGSIAISQNTSTPAYLTNPYDTTPNTYNCAIDNDGNLSCSNGPSTGLGTGGSLGIVTNQSGTFAFISGGSNQYPYSSSYQVARCTIDPTTKNLTGCVNAGGPSMQASYGVALWEGVN